MGADRRRVGCERAHPASATGEGSILALARAIIDAIVRLQCGARLDVDGSGFSPCPAWFDDGAGSDPGKSCPSRVHLYRDAAGDSSRRPTNDLTALHGRYYTSEPVDARE